MEPANATMEVDEEENTENMGLQLDELRRPSRRRHSYDDLIVKETIEYV